LVYFTVICHILWPFGMFYGRLAYIFNGNLVYFLVIFLIWYVVAKKIWQPWLVCKSSLLTVHFETKLKSEPGGHSFALFYRHVWLRPTAMRWPFNNITT
jgi:hypothetical protein